MRKALHLIPGMKNLRFMCGRLPSIPFYMMAVIAGSDFRPANYAPGTLGELLYPISDVSILRHSIEFL